MSTIIHLGGYSWVEHSVVHLKPCSSSEEMIQAFATSADFQDFKTTFPKEEVGTGDHGPFKHGAIQVEDFRLLSASDFLAEIRKCRLVAGVTDDTTEDQWREVEQLLVGTVANNEWFWQLIKTEQDKELRWHGAYHDLFREFLAAKSGLGEMQRIVVGAD